MADVTRAQLETALKEYIDPYLATDLLTAKAIKAINIENVAVTLDISLGFPANGYHNQLQTAVTTVLTPLLAGRKLILNISSQIVPHATQAGIAAINNVKNVIAIASGKGGVGKSTTTVNLALALQAEGARVGILDADIYGPNQPQMLGAHRQPTSTDGKTLEPVVSHGIQSMSIGYLVEIDTAMIWRGPMVSSALQQLLNDTQWDNLDYLLIDLPPGTGDIHLTMAQKIPVSGAVIVTTPQDIALLDVRKAIKMFEKVNVPVLGVIENMSMHICSQCGHAEHIFGSGGGANIAAEYKVPLLGALPLDKSIRELADQGTPSVAMDPTSKISQIYREIARKMAAKLSLRAKSYASKFPKIIVENK